MVPKKLIFLALSAAALAAQAQGPANPLPVSVGLVPVTLGAQPAMGLNVGMSDWDVSLGLPKLRSSNYSPFSVGSAYVADRPMDDGLRGGLFGSLGASWKFSQASRLGFNYRIDSPVLPDGLASRSVGVNYGYQFRSGLSLRTTLDRGLNDSAARWGGGLSITYSR